MSAEGDNSPKHTVHLFVCASESKTKGERLREKVRKAEGAVRYDGKRAERK